MFLTGRTWLELPVTWTPEPTERHAAALTSLLEPATKPDLVPDAHLAALAIEHGLTLCSTDRDVARFEGLRWTGTPCAASPETRARPRPDTASAPLHP